LAFLAERSESAPKPPSESTTILGGAADFPATSESPSTIAWRILQTVSTGFRPEIAALRARLSEVNEATTRVLAPAVMTSIESPGPMRFTISRALDLASSKRDGRTSVDCMLADESRITTILLSCAPLARTNGRASASASSRSAISCSRSSRLFLSFWNGAFAWISDTASRHSITDETVCSLRLSLSK